ncbi:MAG TPA: serine hydrolase domain-containing protein [Prolixibacteraceae bacterium]|nr:serine hydrolase domain-containing protein [Prolixibacteraceae bacterium]
MTLHQYILGCWLFFCCSCKTDGQILNSAQTNFPLTSSDQWKIASIDSLGWNKEAIEELKTLLKENGTRAFLVIKEGKIVLEEYFGKDLPGIADFNKNKQWYWASAGKTLTAFTVGLAQEDGYLNIDDKTSDYLGKHWTTLTTDQEDKITIKNQLTMTSGLDDSKSGRNSFAPSNLTYKTDAGTRWAYHNAPYTLLEKVVGKAVGKDFDDYFDEKLASKIGMDGEWRWLGEYHIFFSTARSMARFGLLILNKGSWNGETIMKDQNFFNEMITPSQNLNKSYGYLWWLNGKESYMLPQSQKTVEGSLTPNAPPDMVSGLGKNGQFLNVVPSLNLVVVRMGENPGDSSVAASFQNKIWEKLNAIMNR